MFAQAAFQGCSERFSLSQGEGSSAAQSSQKRPSRRVKRPDRAWNKRNIRFVIRHLIKPLDQAVYYSDDPQDGLRRSQRPARSAIGELRGQPAAPASSASGPRAPVARSTGTSSDWGGAGGRSRARSPANRPGPPAKRRRQPSYGPVTKRSAPWLSMSCHSPSIQPGLSPSHVRSSSTRRFGPVPSKPANR